MSRRWFVIRTKTNRETSARMQYERQGHEVYLPLIRRTVRHARRNLEVLRPFFPGYLFLHLDPESADWVAIASTYDAIGAIRFGNCYAPVPDWVIEDLKARERNGAIELNMLQSDWLIPGAAIGVRLDTETVASGIVYSSRGKANVVVLLELMGRALKATVPIDRLCRPASG
ncbi:transcriptional activator RfaH [Desulfatirhabdium butyrativorans]|uniref:transcriptional activator RfaH n=1 Tax=Desulfatirhabdium butyrativorans TaxID=340467 RepID=UPI000410D1BB|nr:transcriptional activator RfaH [Desulfatirhabdium butyrativorans]